MVNVEVLLDVAKYAWVDQEAGRVMAGGRAQANAGPYLAQAIKRCYADLEEFRRKNGKSKPIHPLGYRNAVGYYDRPNAVFVRVVVPIGDDTAGLIRERLSALGLSQGLPNSLAVRNLLNYDLDQWLVTRMRELKLFERRST